MSREQKELTKRMETAHLFHRLWAKAVGAEGYKKSEWVELENRILELAGMHKVGSR